MKKSIGLIMAYAAIMFMIMMSISCVSKQVNLADNPEDLVKRTNAIYLDIKTVVTDPEVQPLLSSDTMMMLKDLEQKYLFAANALKGLEFSETDPTVTIVNCTDTILNIIDYVVLQQTNTEKINKYAKHIAAVRISLKVLRNHIQLE